MTGTPPNEIAERAILGLLLSGKISLAELDAQSITPEHFHCHRMPYNEIATFARNGGGDVSELIIQAAENGTLDSIGGAHFYTALTQEGVISAFPSYVKVLRQTYGKHLKARWGAVLARDPTNTQGLQQIITGQAEIDLASSDSIASMIEARTFNVSTPPADPPPMVKLGNHGIFTAGNISMFLADRKAGKSSALSAMLAAMFAPPYSQGDFLGFTAENPEGKAVVHFDTEQSPADHHNLILRALRRAGLQEPPPWFASFSLSGLSLTDRTRFIDHVCEREAVKHGGLQMSIIDGIADLCCDPNDPHESFALVDKWHNFAVNHHCVCLAVLHLNPGTEKSRGHLGSQLDRKVETPLVIKKDMKGISSMFATYARKSHIPQSEAFCFQWCEKVKMHVSISQAQRDAEKETIKRNKAADEANRIMAGRDPMSYTELCQAIEETLTLKVRAQSLRIKDWLAMGIIAKDKSGTYSLKY
jgi:hypothetical protein